MRMLRDRPAGVRPAVDLTPPDEGKSLGGALKKFSDRGPCVGHLTYGSARRVQHFELQFSVPLGAGNMRSLAFFIEDDRYSVPTLEFVVVDDLDGARELANRRLVLSAHIRRIDVREADDLLFEVVASSHADQTSPSHARNASPKTA
jgi:hypothetical protein